MLMLHGKLGDKWADTWVNTRRNLVLGCHCLTVEVDGTRQLRQTVDVAIQLNDKVTRVPNVSHKCRLHVI